MPDRPHRDPFEPDEEQIGEFAAAYADALLAPDEAAAELVLREAMDAGLPPATINDQVIAPALWLVGELWREGKLSIADEQRATEITVRVLTLQREALRVSELRPHHRVILATLPGERHVVALRMVANLLENAGYDVLMLGTDVPAWMLADAADGHDVDVICLSLTLPGRWRETLRVIDEVRRRRPSVRFVVGGRGVTAEGQLRSEVHTCARVSDAVETVDAALLRAPMN